MHLSFYLHPHTVHTLRTILCLVVFSLLFSGCGNRAVLELLEAEAITVRERSIRKLQHKGYPASAVRWESSNAAVASVDHLGYVMGRSQGKTSISVIHKSDSRVRDSITIEVVSALTIKLMPQTIPSLKVGTSLQLEALVEGGDNPAVNWNSSNPAVASISPGGMVQALSAGSSVVSATSQADPTVKAELQLTILADSSIEVSLNMPSPQSLGIANTLQLIATVSNASNPAVRWESSNPDVATVNEGLVQAKSVGNTTIQAVSLADESKSASLELSVPEAVGVLLVPSTLQSLAVGQTLQLQGIVSGSDNQALTWSSSATDVASVDGNGLVTARTQGQTIITATSQADSRARASLEIEVVPPASAVVVQLTPNTPRRLRLSETLQISAQVLGSDNPAVGWSSNNPQVAEVQDGLVTAKALGVAIITATAGADPTSQAHLEVMVTEAPVVHLEPSTRQTILIKETRQLSARVSGSPNQSVTWSSDHPSIASVDASGLIRAISSGQTTIRATSQADPSAQASVQVDVVDTVIELGSP